MEQERRQAAWRKFAVGDGPPPELAATLDSGRPVVVVGRWSAPNGDLACRRAVEDLLGAVEVLRDRAHIDFLPVVPPVDVLERRLVTSKTHVTSRATGTPLRHRFLTADLTREAGLVLLAATGTGSKVDESGLQPFIEAVRQCVIQFKPAIFACKRVDRLTRNKWAYGPVMACLEEMNSWLCDHEGAGTLDSSRSLHVLVEGFGASQEAANLMPKSRRGQRNNTGHQMEAGQVAYHASATAPPGTVVVDMKGSGPKVREKLLYLDTAACRPDPESVAAGMPEIFDHEGNRVDGVENVRFALARHGLPAWPVHRLVDALRLRGFSTPGLRSYRNDLSAIIDNEGPLKTLLNRLSEYETETITINLGELSFDITGFTPPDGQPWASPEDFARIRRHQSKSASNQAGRTWLALSGLSVTVDGTEGRMLTETTPREGLPPTRYRFVDKNGYPSSSKVFVRGALLPHDELAESIVDGLLAVCDGPLEPASAVKPDERAIGLDRQAAELERAVSEGRERMDVLAQRIADGELSGALLRRIADDYNRLADIEVPDKEQQLTAIRSRIDDELARPEHGAPTSKLLLLVENLRAASDTTLRGLWREALDLAVTLERTEPDSAPGVLIHWRGTVLLSDGAGGAVDIPFAGSYDTQSTRSTSRASERHRSRLAADADAVIEHLRAGQLWPEKFATNERVLREVIARLGHPPGASIWLVNCDDARISRIATECRLAPDESAATIAGRLNEAEALVDRVGRVHNEPSGAWLLRGHEVEVVLHAIAASSEGLVTADQVCAAVGTSRGTVYTVMHELKQRNDLWATLRKRGYQMSPCRCGSYRRAPSRLREVEGPICLDCRVDVAGVEWPSDPYDTYLAHPHLWQLAETEHPE